MYHYLPPQKLDEMGHLHLLLDEMGLDEMGESEMPLRCESEMPLGHGRHKHLLSTCMGTVGLC